MIMTMSTPMRGKLPHWGSGCAEGQATGISQKCRFALTKFKCRWKVSLGCTPFSCGCAGSLHSQACCCITSYANFVLRYTRIAGFVKTPLIASFRRFVGEILKSD